MPHHHLRLSCAFLLAVTLGCPLAPAANFTWGAPQNITGNSNVSTNGSLIGAFNVGGTGVAPTTINTVNFQSFAVPNGSTGATVGNFALTGPPLGAGNFFGSPSAPFSTLPSEYRALLGAGIYQGFGFTLTIAGLIVGAQYEFQWWCNYSEFSQTLHSATAEGSTVSLLNRTPDSNGGLGQYAIGTFTAGAATESIAFTGFNGQTNALGGLLNGFQLRQTSAVPESGSSLALLVLALGLIACRRRALAQA